MTWVSRTFSIALCLFSYKNNELLFQIKILTHKYDMFIQNKIDLFTHTHTHTHTMPQVSRTFGIALGSFLRESNDLLFWMKILTRSYDIFILNKTNLFTKNKALCVQNILKQFSSLILYDGMKILQMLLKEILKSRGGHGPLNPSLALPMLTNTLLPNNLFIPVEQGPQPPRLNVGTILLGVRPKIVKLKIYERLVNFEVTKWGRVCHNSRVSWRIRLLAINQMFSHHRSINGRKILFLLEHQNKDNIKSNNLKY